MSLQNNCTKLAEAERVQASMDPPSIWCVHVVISYHHGLAILKEYPKDVLHTYMSNWRCACLLLLYDTCMQYVSL